MKVAIPVMGTAEDSLVETRFARASTFAIVDVDSGSVEFVQNPAASAAGGAGPKAVQFLVDQGVEAVVAGQIGPNAQNALRSAGIKAYQAVGGTLKEVIEKFKAGELREI